MRWLWLCLAAAFMGATHPTPVENPAVTETRFRNGVSPDASFDGMVMTFIDEAATTDDNGADEWAEMGSVTLGADRARILWKCDLSSLPSNYIVDRAVLRMLISTTDITSQYFTISGFRVLARWEESANWGNRVTSTATDTTWAAAGLQDDVGSASYRGTSLTGMTAWRWPLSADVAAFTGREGGGYYTAATVDSVYSYYGLSAAADRPPQPVFTYTLRRQGTGAVQNDSLWVEIPVTHAVKMWASKRWANHGLLLIASTNDVSVTGPMPISETDGDALTARIRVVSEEYSYHNLFSRRPVLRVWGAAVESANQSWLEYMPAFRRWIDE